MENVEIFRWLEYEKSITASLDLNEEDEAEGVPPVISCNKTLDSLEKEHSTIYKKLYNSLSFEDKTILKRSQQEWIKGREEKCYTEQQKYAGGSMAGLVFCRCTMEEVERRIEVLRKGAYQ